MDFKVLKTNMDITYVESAVNPLFNRVCWMQAFEKYICHEQLTPITFQFIENDKSFYLPLAKRNNTKNLNSLANYYSPFFQVLSEEPILKNTFVDALVNAKKELNKFELIDIVPLYKKDMEAWILALESIGFKCFNYHHSTNWYQENIKSVAHYWSLRPSKLQNTVKRKTEKLKSDSEYAMQIKVPKSLIDLELLLTHYHNIYFHSWKPIEPYPAFIDEIVKLAWCNNELRVGLIYHKKLPVAAQIWFVHNRVAYIFKLAYRKEYRKISVGTVLTAAMMDYVIDIDGVTCIDFLTGNDEYKKDWMQSSRPLYGVQACNLKTMKGIFSATNNSISNFYKYLIKN